jgi:DNA-directed RNA polymerase subunit M/transcription elongation factor TFIIS
MGFLPYVHALDLEHACYVVAEINSSPYARPCLKAFYALERSETFARCIRARGALQALALSDEAVFGKDVMQEEAIKREDELNRYRQLLTDLGKNDIQLGNKDSGVRCAKCKSTDVSFKFLQIRSGDEATSVFVTCARCSKRWRLG